MKKVVIVFALFFLIGMSRNQIKANSFGILGEVDHYVITVNPLKDGSIKMQYHISLTITGEKVDQIKIRLPQGSPTVISFDSHTIASFDFSYRQANIFLSKTYEKGSKLHFTFTILMAHAYRYNEKKEMVIYRMTIGEVKDFINKEMVVNWAKNGVYFPGRGKEEGNYYVFRQEYSLLRSFQVMVQYTKNSFQLETPDSAVSLEDYFYQYWLVSVGLFVIVLEIRKNIQNRRASKFPFRTKNVIS